MICSPSIAFWRETGAFEALVRRHERRVFRVTLAIPNKPCRTRS